MEPHIEIRNLNVYYGDSQALKNINLTIPKHQITVIMGPSGCGKTTLLKSMNRFLELVDGIKIDGQVLIDGDDIYTSKMDVTEIRMKTGLLAQRPYPLPMSIYDNIAYGPRIHGLKNVDKIVERSLRDAALWEGGR